MKTVVIELGVNRPKYIREPLIEYPEIVFYGFDPCPAPHEKLAEALEKLEKEFPNFRYLRKAVWIREEVKEMEVSGYKGAGSTIVDKIPCNGNLNRVTKVECIDFDRWVKETLLPSNNNILRADIEGSEYYLFPHMIKKGSMRYFKAVMFEPHHQKMSDPALALLRHQNIMKWLAENDIPASDEFKELFFQQDFTSQ